MTASTGAVSIVGDRDTRKSQKPHSPWAAPTLNSAPEKMVTRCALRSLISFRPEAAHGGQVPLEQCAEEVAGGDGRHFSKQIVGICCCDAKLLFKRPQGEVTIGYVKTMARPPLYLLARYDDFSYPQTKHLTLGLRGSIIGRLFSEKFDAPQGARIDREQGGIGQLLILSARTRSRAGSELEQKHNRHL